MGNTSSTLASPLAGLTRALGRRLAAERAELRFGVAELAQLAGIQEAELEAAEAGHVPVSSMVWVWAWAALVQARRVFGEERRRRPQHQPRRRQALVVQSPPEPLPAAPPAVEVLPAIQAPPDPEPAATAAAPAPVADAAARVPDLAPELAAARAPELAPEPDAPKRCPKHRTLFRNRCGGCGREARQQQERFGRPRAGWKPHLHGNYRPTRSSILVTWGASGPSNRGAANARRNADGKVHQARTGGAA